MPSLLTTIAAQSGLPVSDVRPCVRRSHEALSRCGRRLRDHVGDVVYSIWHTSRLYRPGGPVRLPWWLEAWAPRHLMEELAVDLGLRRCGARSTAASQLDDEDEASRLASCPAPDYAHPLEEAEELASLGAALAALRERDRELLLLRAGGATWREIGARLGGVTPQRVQQLETKALQRLAQGYSSTTGEETCDRPAFNLRKRT